MATVTRMKPTSGAAPTGTGGPLVVLTKSASRNRETDDKILKFYLQSIARELAPHHRVRSCLRAHVPKRDSVEIWFNSKASRAYYRNLMRCGSVWVCPLCASAITEKRQDELKNILTSWEEIWYPVDSDMERTIKVPRWHLGLATFTVAHRSGVSLASVLGTLDRAYKSMWSGRWATAWKSKRQIVGTIRALEVTHGDNGWHPHIHTLVVRRTASTPQNTIDMELDLQFRWNDCVSLAGGVVDPIHGVDYRAATENAIEYISKLGVNVTGNASRWSAVSELVKSPVKRGRRGSMTTWDLLQSYASGDVRSGELWIEAMRNLKGRRHLVPSKGLYETLKANVMEMADSELAEDTHTETDVLLASLTLAEWKKIAVAGLRGQVVTVASMGDRALLLDYLESIL